MDTKRRAEGLGVIYFASGSNLEGEIQGFSQVGMHVGATANELGPGAFSAICDLKSPTRFFFDSGAFSEVQERPNGPPVPVPGKEIALHEWYRRLEMAEEIGKHLGERLYAVSPDRVGSQDGTIRRLDRFTKEVWAIRKTGARILVCLQRGNRDLDTMDHACASVLGFDDFVRAVPMKKAATSLKDLANYLRHRRPPALHLLGIGVHSKGFNAILEACRTASPTTEISCDSVIIRALVGRYPGGRGRPLTLAADGAVDQCNDWWNADCGDLDWTEGVVYPSCYTTPAQRREIAKRCFLDTDETGRFVKDPDAFMQEVDKNGIERYLDPCLEVDLDHAWRVFAVGAYADQKDGRKRFIGGRGNVSFRKREAIVRVFGER